MKGKLILLIVFIFTALLLQTFIKWIGRDDPPMLELIEKKIEETDSLKLNLGEIRGMKVQHLNNEDIYQRFSSEILGSNQRLFVTGRVLKSEGEWFMLWDSVSFRR
ncbi:hypothetical protein [Jiulongibacter sediminis]|uniref:hypothetical protein n=1 Tax=Jiulongibacter sediminis TaxID=1605367 RepID=UPI0026EF2693|nr:hypothetical protein [Jiulongibacter sediminis]